MASNESEKQGGLSRRDFIKSAAVTAAAGAALTGSAQASVVKTILPSAVLGANERILTGHIGIGGMGRSNLIFALQRPDMQPIALCDIWYRNRDRAEQMVKQRVENFTLHHDFREVIDNKDVDAVVISTPDHWHCVPVLFAADAGKAIFCEKPLSTTIEEANVVEEKIKETGVIFQAGTMQRSGAHFQEAVELIQSGYLGQVARVETFIHDNDSIDGIGMGDDTMPDKCDWEFQQGWVAHQPFNTNRWIYNFRWFLDYSGGKITDWGAHLIDIAIWAMGQEKEPKSITAQGGKYILQDNRTTPDTLSVLWEFDDYVLSFENRVYNGYRPEGFQDHGIVFHGTFGTMVVDRGGYRVFAVDNNRPPEDSGWEIKTSRGGPINEPHWENFADCIRSGERPICDVDVIAQTTRICHMGTCAYVAGAKLNWDPANQNFTGGDTEAVEKANHWAYRPYENGWSLKAPYYKA